MSTISHWLNTELHVWRRTLVADGSGGYTETWTDLGAAMFKVDQSTAAEQEAAAQYEARHTHNIYGEPDADVDRLDRLAPSGVQSVDDPAPWSTWYEVISTTAPSTPRYLKAAAERIQVGG